VNSKPENKFIQEEEINLYYYWKVLVRRKRVFIAIFLVPIAIVAGVSLLQPRYYLGQREIINPVIPPQNIVGLLGNFDDAKKAEVFINTPGAIKSVLLSAPKNTKDRVSILLESNSADVMPQAFLDLENYIRNVDEIKDATVKMTAEIDYQLEAFLRAKKANLLFLNRITDMMKNQRESSHIYINPADLIEKDADLLLEINRLQREKLTKGSFGPISVTKLPTISQIMIRIICVGILSLLAGIFVVFVLLDYIDRVRTRENK
jgi:hypothetical protein